MKKLLLIFLVLSNAVYSQLVTSTYGDLTGFMENYFSQNGNVFNTTYTGHPNAIGSYDATNTCLSQLGLTNGIIMTTGSVDEKFQNPIGPNNNDEAGIDNLKNGSASLNSMISSTTYNAATLEFDFIAQSDTFFINYVFGSEEYLEYVDEGFNDLIAILISGPDIYNQNIARLSNNNIVCVDNLNNESNSSYYIDNGDGTGSQPFYSDPYYIQYDGYTTLLKASSLTTIGETYHIRIVIADAGDAIYDSGVFLSSNSFGYTSLDEKDFNKPSVFPNPVNNILSLDNYDLNELEKIELINVLGNIVTTFKPSKSIDLTSYKEGIYFLKIDVKSRIDTHQIIISH